MRIAGYLLLSLVALALGDDTTAERDPARWEEAIQRFEEWDAKNSVPQDAVLFAGSSSIVGWSTGRDFPELPVINRGFGGSYISEVSHFFGRIVAPYKPAVIVFYAGDNDIADDKSPARVLDDYQKFVGLVRDQLPGTRVVFITIKPSLARWSKWPQMHEANELIRKLSAAEDDLYFADIAAPMLGSDGRPRAELFLKDGLHLNEAGYRLWTSVVAPLVNQALAARAGAQGHTDAS